MRNNLTSLPDLNNIIINHRILGKEEEHDLIIRAQDGDIHSQHQLILHNLKLIIMVRNEMIPLHSAKQDVLDDTLSLGISSLYKAIDKFEFGKNAAFATYAKWWIQCSIRKYLVEKGTIRTPSGSHNKVRKLKRLLKENSIELTLENLNLGICDYAINQLKGVNKRNVRAYLIAKSADKLSMQQLMNEGDTTREEITIVAGDKDYTPICDDKEIIKEQIEKMLNTLKVRDAVILTLRFGLGDWDEMTLHRISLIVGLTRERVRQLQKSALEELRRGRTSKEFY